MKKYDYIIFDIDDTLLNCENTEKNILRKIFQSEGKAFSMDIYQELEERLDFYYDTYHLACSDEVYVQNNYHTLYRKCLLDFMTEVREKYHFAATGEALTEAFMTFFQCESEIYEDAEEVLQYFAKTSSLALASNGFEAIQRNRIDKLKDYFSEIFISEELDTIKASSVFWDKVFARIPAEPKNCLMVGDSLKNDIVSTSRYGLDTCFVNRKGEKNETGTTPTYEIKELRELKNLLR